MRLQVIFLAFAAVTSAGPPAPELPGEFVHAVEFPYYLYPRPLWERELVWLKNLGVTTVESPVPWNWQEPEAGRIDWNGTTSSRRDLIGFLRILRRLGLRAWLRPLPTVRGWIREGYPVWAQGDRRAEQEWLRELARTLDPLTEKHGGPVAFVEAPGFEVPGPPQPVTVVSAVQSDALVRARQALNAGHGTLLWEDVEDAVYPVGWEPAGGALLRSGAVSLAGTEGSTVTWLRRDGALLRSWASLLASMRPHESHDARPVEGKFPEGVSAVQLVAPPERRASAVNLINDSDRPWQGDLRVYDAAAHRGLVVPKVQAAAHGALWMPVGVSLAASGLCANCSSFANDEHVVYATAELQKIEFENGILAMEFAAPHPGEVILQLSREPSGPYLAAGHPEKFDWDPRSSLARLRIPQGKAAGDRVRIGLAIEPPESSAFFGDAKRLVIGQKNLVNTSYSSEQLARRSRLLAPEGFVVKAVPKSPTEIAYEVEPPAACEHGDWAELAIEVDGVTLGRARLQLFRPASIRFPDGIKRHLGQTVLPVDPPILPLDARAGRSLDVVIHNNFPAIETYRLEPSGEGIQFLPAHADISLGAALERTSSLRVFPQEGGSGLRDWRLHISGAAQVEVPARFLLVPRGRSVAWSADLDGDGAPEYVLENQHARAVFSAQDGGRWLEFVWKDSDTNVLPESGALAGTGPVGVRVLEGALEFVSAGWTRTVRLAGQGARLVIEQNAPLPAETLRPVKVNEVRLSIERPSASHAEYVIAPEKTEQENSSVNRQTVGGSHAR